MKAYGGVDLQLHVFLTSELVGGGQIHAPAALPPGKEPPVPIGKEAVWAPELGEEKNLAPTGTRTPTPLSSTL
jgi:hypothetical protein